MKKTTIKQSRPVLILESQGLYITPEERRMLERRYSEALAQGNAALVLPVYLKVAGWHYGETETVIEEDEQQAYACLEAELDECSLQKNEKDD